MIEMKQFHDSDYVDFLITSSKSKNSYYEELP